MSTNEPHVGDTNDPYHFTKDRYIDSTDESLMRNLTTKPLGTDKERDVATRQAWASMDEHNNIDNLPPGVEPRGNGQWVYGGEGRYYLNGRLADPAAVVDALNARPAPPPAAEQWIITAGTNIHSPVGPFASEEGAEDYYKANQPRGGTWLAKPAIVRLLRPAAVEALSRTTEDKN